MRSIGASTSPEPSHSNALHPWAAVRLKLTGYEGERDALPRVSVNRSEREVSATLENPAKTTLEN